VGTGSREENAKKEREKHFRAKHALAKAGVDAGWQKKRVRKQEE